jgi:hypothetical protein
MIAQRCAYAGCPTGNPVAVEDEQVTCPECRRYLELDSLVHIAQVFQNKGPVRFVNVYLEHQAYGGPEEGGWWYVAGELCLCEPWPSAETAETRAGELRAGCFSNDGLPPLSSVRSGGRYRVVVSLEPGASYPVSRPRYE